MINRNATLTLVSDAATSTTLLASNPGRRGWMIWNNSTEVLYVLLDSGTASASNCNFKLDPDERVSSDQIGPRQEPYMGDITGIWAANAGGAAHISSF